MSDAAADMRAFEPVIGRWRTSGTVLDEHGAPTAKIEGIDEYEWMPGGHWVVHRLDVTLGEDQAQAFQVIGEHDPETGSYLMWAFDGSGTYGTLTVHPRPDGSFRIQGDGVRSMLSPGEDSSLMSALWERELADRPGTWIRWMDMRFDRID